MMKIADNYSIPRLYLRDNENLNLKIKIMLLPEVIK
jgi:hypothetical protein